jgi:hypothetical protein
MLPIKPGTLTEGCDVDDAVLEALGRGLAEVVGLAELADALGDAL